MKGGLLGPEGGIGRSQLGAINNLNQREMIINSFTGFGRKDVGNLKICGYEDVIAGMGGKGGNLGDCQLDRNNAP